MQKITLYIRISLLSIFFLVFTAFNFVDAPVDFIQQTLQKYHDPARFLGALKKSEFQVTNTGLCKHKRFYNNGKIEFFSFHFSRLKEIEFLGTENNGELIFLTKADDIIVQTHQDRKGNVDTMATSLRIPLKGISAEELTNLTVKVNVLKERLLRQ